MERDPYRYFRIEARELLDGLGRGVLDLEKRPGDKALVGTLLRQAHTLKGASRVVKRIEIGDLAHAVEDQLAPYRDGGPVTVPREAIDGLLKLLDAIAEKLAALEPAPPRASDAAARPAPSDDFVQSVRVDVREMDTLLEAVLEAGVQATGLERQLEAIEGAHQVARVVAEQLRSPRAEGAVGAGATLSRLRTLSDDLRSSLARIHRALGDSVARVGLEIAGARDAADRLRLLPASAVFGPLERAVRDAAQALGKTVRLETSGGDARLDAHVLAALRDALLHVVRNAVAHGIESAAERHAVGKPMAGTIRLRVERRGSRAAFVCRDDGRGIDVEAVRGAAVRRGIVPADEAAELSVDQVIDLVLRGGMTTAGDVTHVSGRGVGLDVVRDTAARLKAEVNIETEKGRGTSVEICVPVSLASLSALHVEAAGAVASLPIDAVRQTLRFPIEQVARTGDAAAVSYDGRSIPFVPLSTLLRRASARAAAPRRFWSTVVVQSGSRLAAIGVDRLLGTSDVVVRPLPGFVEADAVVAGASLDVEGVPQIVLDAAAVVAAAQGQAGPAEAPATRRAPILVVDDSLTTRMLEQSILESAGYEVELVTGAEEALLKARERRFGLFLVDVEMPGMDGFELVRATRADPALREVPAILVTSRSSPEDRRRGEEVGARAYIVKSEFDQGELLEIIRQLVG